MPFINVYFYAPGETDHVINHMVIRWDPPYAHCDVQFEDGMASSLFQGESLYWRKRSFRKPGYTRVTVSVNHADYDRAYRLCQDRFFLLGIRLDAARQLHILQQALHGGSAGRRRQGRFGAGCLHNDAKRIAQGPAELSGAAYGSN